jgi:hypothetical protein
VCSAPRLHSGKGIYVDQRLRADCFDRYDSATQSCGAGSEIGLRDLPTGFSFAEPGDTLILRAGSYGQVAPRLSGAAGKPITVRAYEPERVMMSTVARLA